MLPDPARIPLSDWADARLVDLARNLACPALSAFSGADLLAMRARCNGFAVPGPVSAGGGCRFHRARDGWIALNLSRPDDTDLLPALVGSAEIAPRDPASLPAHLRQQDAAALVAQGRALGMAIAALDEHPVSPPIHHETIAAGRKQRAGQPLVIDLSALWAGPLAGQLLRMGGARVAKVESQSRPDAMRNGDPALFAFLDEGKDHLALDLRDEADRDRLIALIRTADVVIEAARPRALRQLGIDAGALVREVPGLAWVTITGHGVAGDAAGWVGFGDDAGVAGGLSRALWEATGSIAFVGDAIADPLTGLAAAGEAARMIGDGTGGRVILSMSGIVALALEESRSRDAAALARDLERWAAAVGKSFA